jgi:hypothetical protein
MIKLLKHQSSDFIPPKYKSLSLQKIISEDQNYQKLLVENNGGYFYKNALHLFGAAPSISFHDISEMNELFHSLYQELVKGYFCFGEDLFGNLLTFHKERVYLFDIETAEFSEIASDFSKWLEVLQADLDFYCGSSITENLPEITIKKLVEGNRLCPKMPFILGGEYSLDNLVLKNYRANLEFNCDLAWQIVNLPDGTQFSIEIND